MITTLVGFVLASQTATYLELLNHLDRFMPHSAFALLRQMLNQIKAGASGDKLSLGILVSLWTASSGVTALIEALNIAFKVSSSRPWWRRRLVAMLLTLGLGALISGALLFLFTSSAATRLIAARIPILSFFDQLAGAIRWIVGLVLLLTSLMMIYASGPNIGRKRWEGILPGACLALVCWVTASFALRLYLSTIGTLNHSYGSLTGVVALLFWLYLSAAAILLGVELNAAIWEASVVPLGTEVNE